MPNSDRPNVFGKGKKRTKLSDQELAVITHANLQGLASEDIASLFADMTNRSLDARTIRMVIAEQRAVWQKETRQNTDQHFHMELERLNMMESEAWEQYRQCGGYRRRKDIVRETMDAEGGQVSVKQEELTDDPEIALKWYREIMKLQRERRKLLQLEQVVNFTQNNLFAVKGYAGWTPEAWPDAPEQKVLTHGDVVEGAYE